MVFKSPVAGSSPWEKARRYITSEFAHDLISEDEAVARYFAACHLSPLFGTPRPPKYDENGHTGLYQRWLLVNSESEIRAQFRSGKYAKSRQRYVNLRKICERHGWHSITGRSLDPLHDLVALHHVIPSGKENGPTLLYRKSIDHPELTNDCVLMLQSEHLVYHHVLRKQFGVGVYPTPVNWPQHFVAWLRSYQSVHGLTNPHPSGQPGYWPALRGL